ncbi:tyrosine-type recombinase/integrase [Pseudocolwellia sp. AS88]|uniref:tyrosine-type recombinase/integrase n=1 Tax=Pseudocolwellia sp. AS88 TaxID=3063958 RepID=UPI0026EBDE3A|nr:tyrosine-type recombinase/integrase [Pseudocolwellia sp. AS88]MDO7083251.1 tyrosine-type recombinase/integrase [Pseudocolwellia sp. AS88]
MDSKLKGIKANNSSISISFTYNDVRCRETVKVKPTKSSLKEMARKRDVILYEIAMGQFDYLKHFPNSRTALSLYGNQACNITIKEMVNDWFKRTQDQWEYSTKRGYISKINHHIEPNFGHILINEFKPSIFKDWGATSTLSGKTKNEVRSILRSAFQELFIDEVINSNPIDRVKRFKHIRKEPEPFNEIEREKILNQMSGQVRNLYEFAFWTGLRTSELLALRKSDIDLERKVIFVRKALVHGREKETKTRSSARTHQLHETAFKVLKDQLSLTSSDHERIFLNPKNNQPWRDDRAIYHNCWVPSLKQSGVKFRKQYNTRHTYASSMLTENKPIAWVAKQLGHSDIAMTLSTYARWIPENSQEN